MVNAAVGVAAELPVVRQPGTGSLDGPAHPKGCFQAFGFGGSSDIRGSDRGRDGAVKPESIDGVGVGVLEMLGSVSLAWVNPAGNGQLSTNMLIYCRAEQWFL